MSSCRAYEKQLVNVSMSIQQIFHMAESNFQTNSLHLKNDWFGRGDGIKSDLCLCLQICICSLNCRSNYGFHSLIFVSLISGTTSWLHWTRHPSRSLVEEKRSVTRSSINGIWTKRIFNSFKLFSVHRTKWSAILRRANVSQDISLCGIRHYHIVGSCGQYCSVYSFYSHSTSSDQHLLLTNELSRFWHRICDVSSISATWAVHWKLAHGRSHVQTS